MKNILARASAGIGGTPLMRLEINDAVKLVRAAHDGGVKVFHAPTVGAAQRMAKGLEGLDRDSYALAVSVRSTGELGGYLSAFGTERIDVVLVGIDDGFDAGEFAELRASGKVGAFAAEMRRLGELHGAIACEKFDAIAMPLGGLASDNELTAAGKITGAGLGLIALEPLAGGLWSSPSSAMAFLHSLGAVPLFGVQYMWQLEQLLEPISNPPVLDEDMWQQIHTERAKLAAEYCRGCGECMPCPAGIDIPLAARMGQFMSSMEIEPLISAETERKMRIVRRCVGCGRCAERCRYHLPVRALIRLNADSYHEFLREHGGLE